MLSIPLHDDEVLTSYVSRLAYAHGIYRMRTFCRDLGIDATKLKIGAAQEVRKLAELVDVPLSRLVDAAVTTGKTKPVNLRGEVFNPTTLKRDYQRFCPHCLVDDLATRSPYPGSQTYYRAAWFFPQVTACITHERSIVEIERPGIIETGSHDFCALLGNLPDGVEALASVSLPRKPTSFERYIVNRVEGRSSPHPFLDAMRLEAVILMCERFGTASVYGRKATARKLGSEEMVKAREEGFEKLSKGEPGIQAILDKLANSKESGSFSAHGRYGELYMLLNKSFKAAEYDIFRDIMKAHAATQDLLAGTGLFGKPLENDLLRVRDVAAELGIAESLVRSTLKRHGRAGELGSGVGLLSSDVKREVENHLENAWSWREAREHLGCDLTTQRKLYEAGVLTSGPEYSQGTCDKTQVLALEKKLRERCTDVVREDQVSVWDAVRPSESSIAEIIQIVLSGKLQSVWAATDARIFQGLRLLVEEVKRSHFPAGTITMSEAGEMLSLSASGISSLLVYGGLKAEKLAFPRDKWWAVDRAAAQDFQRDYITLLECREISKRTQNWLSSNAKRQGIEPAFPTSKVGQAIFERRLAGAIMTDSRR